MATIRPSPPPPPPPPPPFGPISYRLPLYGLSARRRQQAYLTTLAMRQKLQTPNKEEWVITIEDKVKEVHKEEAMTSWEKHCIYKIPHYLKKTDEKSYSPQTVSLGPFHNGEKHLLPMDHHKWRAVTMVLKRNNQDIELYINAMKELEKRARACYQGPISLDSTEFIKMLVLDGCFVIELFRGASEDDGFMRLGYDVFDPVFAMRCSMHSIQRDMIMLENQLPLFVLDRLLELQPDRGNQTVAQLAIQFLDPLMPTNETSIKTENSIADDEITNMGGLHCLDVFRRNLLRHCSKPQPRKQFKRTADKRQQQLIHCVTELREAGIRLRKRKTDRIWDIRFKKGCLWIPKLFIHHGTKSLFSNLIAFEQLHTYTSNIITSYAIFMDNLIDSAEDVKYLHYHDIIEHCLGNDSEVANLFNRLCQEVAFDLEDSYLYPVHQKVIKFYSRKWNVAKATLKHKYFNNPWAYFSFFAAVSLLLLTLYQSFFTSLPYFYPPS